MQRVICETRTNRVNELRHTTAIGVMALIALYMILSTAMLCYCEVQYERQGEQLDAARGAIAGYHALLRGKR